MRLENLKPGKGVEVTVTRDEYCYHLKTTVEISKIGRVFVTLIASGARAFPFQPKDRVDIMYRDGDRMWIWKQVEASQEVVEGEKLHCFKSLKEGESFNRRDSYRVQLNEKIIFKQFIYTEELKEEEDALAVIDEYGNDLNQTKEEEFKGMLKDISETGAGFFTDHNLKIGDSVGFSLVTSYGTMHLKGEVVRHVPSRHGRYREFYGAIFKRTDKKLAKYLFDQQRLLLKKIREK